MAGEAIAKTAEEIEAAIKEDAVGPVPDHWSVKSVAELVADGVLAKIQDGNHGEIHPISEDYVPSGVPFVMSGDIWHGRVDVRGCKFIRPEHACSLRVGHSKKGDVLLTHKGNELGRSGILRDADYAVLTPQVTYYRVLNQQALEPEFLRWLFESPRFQHQFKRDAAQSTRPFVSITNQQRLYLSLPPLAEQKAIAAVLGALDDKIDLNRRMNATLEAIARALFQSWFVDFDPVRAKLDGRKPVGLDEATAAFFPATFQDSPLVHIPTGWKAAELGQIADIIDCLHAKKPEGCESGQLYLQLNNIRDDGLIDITDCFFVSAADYQKWISRMEANEGDCVITNVGRVGAVAQIPEGVKAALGRNITGIRCRADFQFPTFLIECLLSESMREEIRLKTDSGTILDALNVKSIPKLRFARPSREIGARFERLTRPLRRRMEQNVSESRTLATLRDTLLPKLLSGELSVAAAQKKSASV